MTVLLRTTREQAHAAGIPDERLIDTGDGRVAIRPLMTEVWPAPKTAAARVAYSPDQARDERGRWTDEGEGAESDGGTALASERIERAERMAAELNRARDEYVRSGQAERRFAEVNAILRGRIPDDERTSSAAAEIAEVLPNAEVDIRAMQPEMAEEVARTISDWAEQFPESAKSVVLVALAPSDALGGDQTSVQTGLAGLQDDGRAAVTLVFNANDYAIGKPEFLEKITEYEEVVGWHRYSDTEAIVQHELGHVLDMNAYVNTGPGSANVKEGEVRPDFYLGLHLNTPAGLSVLYMDRADDYADEIASGAFVPTHDGYALKAVNEGIGMAEVRAEAFVGYERGDEEPAPGMDAVIEEMEGLAEEPLVPQAAAVVTGGPGVVTEPGDWRRGPTPIFVLCPGGMEPPSSLPAKPHLGAVRLAYSPDQARDERGWWVEEGGGENTTTEHDAEVARVLDVYRSSFIDSSNMRALLDGRDVAPAYRDDEGFMRNTATLGRAVLDGGRVSVYESLARPGREAPAEAWRVQAGDPPRVGETQDWSIRSTARSSEMALGFAMSQGEYGFGTHLLRVIDPHGVEYPDGSEQIVSGIYRATETGTLRDGTAYTTVVYEGKSPTLERTVTALEERVARQSATRLAYSPDQERDERGRWTDEGGASAAEDLPSRTPPPEPYSDDDFRRVNASGDNDEALRMYRENRAMKEGWETSIRYALSTGKISLEDARERWGERYGSPLIDSLARDLGGQRWDPLPDDLWHVTTNLTGVQEAGELRTRDELKMQGMGEGLGGGSRDTISFTADPDIAVRIYDAMHEARSVAAGETSIQDLLDRATSGEDAKRPYVEDIVSYWWRSTPNATEEDRWHVGQPYPPGLQKLLTDPEHDTPGDRLDFYKNYSLMREGAGGPMDPLFFGTDADHLARMDDRDIAIVHVQPVEGAAGVSTSALGEWRVPTGDAVRITQIRQPAPRVAAARLADYVEEQHPRGPDGRWVDAEGDDRSADDTSRVRLYHGTTAAAAKAIREGGFKSLNARGVADAVAAKYKVDGGEVFNHDWFAFAKARANDPNVYFTTDRTIAKSYAEARSETVTDALRTIYRIQHGDPDENHWSYSDATAWARKEAETWDKPVVLEVTFDTSRLSEQQRAEVAVGGGSGLVFTPEQIAKLEPSIRQVRTAAAWFPNARLAYSPEQARDERGRWTADGGASDGADGMLPEAHTPRIMVADDPARYGTQPGVNGELTSPSGAPVRGTVIPPDDPRIPDTVYHVTLDKPDIERDGVLLAGGKGGLGGDRNDQIVSLTIDRGVAEQLQDDLRLMVEATNAIIDWPVPDSKWIESEKRWDTAATRAATEPFRQVLKEKAESEGWTFDSADKPVQDSYGPWDLQAHYFMQRSFDEGVQDPIIFGGVDHFRDRDPDAVGIVEVPKANLATGAMVTDFDLSSDHGLKEVRVYGDVPLARRASPRVAYAEDQPREPAGSAEGGRFAKDSGTGEGPGDEKIRRTHEGGPGEKWVGSLWHVTDDPDFQPDERVLHLTDDEGMEFWLNESEWVKGRRYAAEIEPISAEEWDQPVQSSSAPWEWLTDRDRVHVKQVVPLDEALGIIAKRSATRASARVAYSVDQARDERGRWTDEEGDGDAADSLEGGKPRPDLDVAFNLQKAIQIPTAKERTEKWGDANGKVTAEVVSGHLTDMFPNATVEITEMALAYKDHRDVATAVLEGWSRMAEEHPAVAASIDKVTLDASFPPGMFTAWDMSLRLSTYEMIRAKETAAENGFRIDAGKYAYATAIHEFGHAATTIATVNERLSRRDDAYSTGDVGYDHRPDVFDSMGDGGDHVADRPLAPEPEHVSQYAGTAFGEPQAEAYTFAKLADPADVPESVQTFVDWVEARLSPIKIENERAVQAAMDAAAAIEDEFGPGCVAWAYASDESGIRLAYSVDQARDERGRWTDEGGDGSDTIDYPPDRALLDAGQTWTSWSGGRDIRQAANTLVQGATPALDPWLHSTHDPVFDEQVEMYGWPPGYDPEREREENAPYVDRQAEALLDAVDAAPPSDGPLYRGLAMEAEQAAAFHTVVAADALVGMPLMSTGTTPEFAERFMSLPNPNQPRFTPEELEADLPESYVEWDERGNPHYPEAWAEPQGRESVLLVINDAPAYMPENPATRRLYMDATGSGAGDEYVTGGQFQVGSVVTEEPSEPGGWAHTTVTLDYVGPLPRARTAALTRVAYTEDQPRDERGRFTEIDGGAGEGAERDTVPLSGVQPDRRMTDPQSMITELRTKCGLGAGEARAVAERMGPGLVRGSVDAKIADDLGGLYRGQVTIDSGLRDPNIEEVLVDRGRYYNANRVEGGDGVDRMCHWNAAMKWAEDPERYELVTGVAVLGIDSDGAVVWSPHSWVVDADRETIIETNSPSGSGEFHYTAYYGAPLTDVESIRFMEGLVPPMLMGLEDDDPARFSSQPGGLDGYHDRFVELRDNVDIRTPAEIGAEE